MEATFSQTILIGGGFSSLAFLISHLRSGKLAELLKGGVLVLEQNQHFGPSHFHNNVASCCYSGLECTRLILKSPFHSQPDVFKALEVEEITDSLSKSNLIDSNSQNTSTKLFQGYSSAVSSQENDHRKSIISKGEMKGSKNISGKKPLGFEDTPHNETISRTCQLLIQQKVSIDISKAMSFFESSVINAFREILSTQTFQELLMYGYDHPPASLFGYFLRLLSNTVCRYVYTLKNKLIFQPDLQAKQVQFSNNGNLTIRVSMKAPHKNDKEQQTLGNEQQKKQQIQSQQQPQSDRLAVLDQYKDFSCKILILSQGWSQKQLDYDSVWTRIRKELIISSERFLSDEGCVKVFKYLHRYPVKKVVIVGGSHSAFACAELLLRGPKLYTTDEMEDYPLSQFAWKRNNTKCPICQQFYQPQRKSSPGKTHRSSNSPTLRGLNKVEMTTFTRKNLQLSGLQNQLTTTGSGCSKCQCFGSIERNSFEWNKIMLTTPQFNPGEIIIAHRSPINIYFPSKTAALQANYTHYQSNSLNESGEINPITGLRGTARELFYNIIEGVEKRIDLEPFKTDAELDRILDRNTMLVINATGYESTEILIKDLRGNILTLGRDASDQIFSTDESGRVISEQGCIRSIYGIGHNFPLNTTHPLVQSETSNSHTIRARDMRSMISIGFEKMNQSFLQNIGNNLDVQLAQSARTQQWAGISDPLLLDAETFNTSIQKKTKIILSQLPKTNIMNMINNNSNKLLIGNTSPRRLPALSLSKLNPFSQDFKGNKPKSLMQSIKNTPRQ